MRPALTLAAALALMLAAAPALRAQGMFAPRIYVNNSAITEYELDQRTKFIEAIGGAGDSRKAAEDALIDDRLYAIAAKALKVTVTDEQLSRGIAEFAGRANLSPDEFYARMADDGVSRETLRDFVRSGILWREVVRARYGGRVRITDAELDRVMSAEAHRPGIEVALSEIILPMIPEYRDQSLQIAQIIDTEVNTPELFAEAARRFSAAGSRDNGGALDWMPLANLPPRIANVVAGLKPGQKSGRIEVPNAIAYFFFRGQRETARPAPASLLVDYARLAVPGPRAEALATAAGIAARADRCDDLYAASQEFGAGPVARDRQPVGRLPADVALALAPLDTNETATLLGPGGETVLLMLCTRQLPVEPPPDRDQVRSQLLDQRLGALARSYLAELKADAIIRRN